MSLTHALLIQEAIAIKINFDVQGRIALVRFLFHRNYRLFYFLDPIDNIKFEG